MIVYKYTKCSKQAFRQLRLYLFKNVVKIMKRSQIQTKNAKRKIQYLLRKLLKDLPLIITYMLTCVAKRKDISLMSSVLAHFDPIDLYLLS